MVASALSPSTADLSVSPPIPVWLMGLTSASFGMFGGVLAVTVPQLLAATGTPEARVAAVTGLAMVPGVCAFLLSPILDLWLRRRTWAVLFAVSAAIQLSWALLSLDDVPRLSILLFSGFFCAVLAAAAAGGWLGSLISVHDRSRLGAWSTVGNIGGGGVAIIIAIPLLRSLPVGVGAAILGLLTLAPLVPYLWLPAPTPDKRLSSESLTAFARDIAALMRRRHILWLLTLFGAPAAAFALTNTLGGLGAQFHADERFVGLVAGAGVLAAGVIGSLAVPPLMDRIAPTRLYLLIGALGAAFTLLLILLPKTPAVFGLAMLGENIFQAAAFATALAITYRSLGSDNPLAATQVALLTAANAAPIVYMQLVDGRAYGLGGLRGSLAADAAISFLACAILGAILWARRGRRPEG